MPLHPQRARRTGPVAAFLSTLAAALALSSPAGAQDSGSKAAFLEKMATTQDVDGRSLLDNSMIMFGSALKDGNTHSVEDLPLLLAGRGKGTLRPGRRIRYPEHTPVTNLYVSMLQRMGIEQTSFGDSTGPLEGLS